MLPLCLNVGPVLARDLVQRKQRKIGEGNLLSHRDIVNRILGTRQNPDHFDDQNESNDCYNRSDSPATA